MLDVRLLNVLVVVLLGLVQVLLVLLLLRMLLLMDMLVVVVLVLIVQWRRLGGHVWTVRRCVHDWRDLETRWCMDVS